MVFFAPGACRFSAASRPIPGGVDAARGWTLEDYRQLVRTYQGEQIQIVESLDERDTVASLQHALHNARETPVPK